MLLGNGSGMGVAVGIGDPCGVGLGIGVGVEAGNGEADPPGIKRFGQMFTSQSPVVSIVRLNLPGLPGRGSAIHAAQGSSFRPSGMFSNFGVRKSSLKISVIAFFRNLNSLPINPSIGLSGSPDKE